MTRTYELWGFHDSRSAIWIRFCNAKNLDPIDTFNDWTTAYHSDDTCIDALAKSICHSDDDGDYINFELHGLLRICFNCEKTIDWNELHYVDSFPVCLRCVPNHLHGDETETGNENYNCFSTIDELSTYGSIDEIYTG